MDLLKYIYDLKYTCHLQTLNLTNEVITIDDEDDEDVLTCDNLSYEISMYLLSQKHKLQGVQKNSRIYYL